MRKCLLIALILATASGSALAQASSSLGNEAGTVTTTDDDSAPAPKRTSNPAAPTEARKSPARSDNQRSNNPRWHSFLPGMFR